MNRRQKDVIFTGCVVLPLILFFPPWKTAGAGGAGLFRGFFFLLSPTMRECCRVDTGLLLVEMLFIAVITAALCLILREK